MNSFMLSEISIDGDMLRISSSAKRPTPAPDSTNSKPQMPEPKQEHIKRNPTFKIKKSQITFKKNK